MTERPKHSPAVLRPLAHRNFLLVWAGQSISSVGNGIYTVVLAWSAYNLTGSAALLGVVLTANIAPQFVFLLIGGVTADRFGRRIVTLTADALAALVTGALSAAALAHALSAVSLVAASFLLGVTSSFFMPAYSAINRELVPPGELAQANALRNASKNAARIAGPAIGGVCYVAGGAALGFGADAASFAISALAMACTSLSVSTASVSTGPGPQDANRAHKARLKDEILAGARYVWATPWLRVLILLSIVTNTLCVAPLAVLLPAVIKSSGGSVSFLGLAMTIQAASASAFALAIGKWGDRFRPSIGLYALTAVLGGGATMIGIGAGHPAAVILGVVLVGLGFGFTVIEDTAMQRSIPGSHISRVYSIGMLASYALLPVGYLIDGALARLIGAWLILVAGGLATVMLALAGTAAIGVTKFTAIDPEPGQSPGQAHSALVRVPATAATNSSARSELIDPEF